MYMPTPPIEIFGCANNSSDVAISLPALISYALLVGIPSKLSMGGYQAVAKDTAAGILVAARTCHILGRIKWQTTREARKLKTRWACARLPAQRIRGAKLCKGLGGGYWSWNGWRGIWISATFWLFVIAAWAVSLASWLSAKTLPKYSN